MRPLIGPATCVVPLQNGVEAPAQLATLILRFGFRQRLTPGVDMTSNVKSWLPMFLHFLCPLVLRHRKRRSQ